jgi:predicted glycosyltransferase
MWSILSCIWILLPRSNVYALSYDQNANSDSRILLKSTADGRGWFHPLTLDAGWNLMFYGENAVMKKMLVYSHDTYGLGNITRMLAICQYLLEVIPDLSILLVTGSPVVHSLRLAELLDYIKLPCLNRVGRGEYTTKYLSASLNDAIQLRSDLIYAAVVNFKPDLFMVDKKPLGVKRELAKTLEYLQTERPETSLVLILRDILDCPEAVRSNWERNGHYEALRRFYDLVLVLGEEEIFDPVKEYNFPLPVVDRTVYCGYIRREAEAHSRREMRRILGVDEKERLVLVTPGGGQDGYHIVECYLTAIRAMSNDYLFKSLIVCGPEMPEQQKTKLHQGISGDPKVMFYDFTGEMMSLMAASDVVVAMGGYNTVCEILSLKKRAIVIPRVRPTEEQWLRAERMSNMGLFKTIHPDEVTPEHPERLMETLMGCLTADNPSAPPREIDLNALPVVAERIKALLNLDG